MLGGKHIFPCERGLGAEVRLSKAFRATTSPSWSFAWPFIAIKGLWEFSVAQSPLASWREGAANTGAGFLCRPPCREERCVCRALYRPAPGWANGMFLREVDFRLFQSHSRNVYNNYWFLNKPWLFWFGRWGPVSALLVFWVCSGFAYFLLSQNLLTLCTWLCHRVFFSSDQHGFPERKLSRKL